MTNPDNKKNSITNSKPWLKNSASSEPLPNTRSVSKWLAKT